jgi:hypothetical protein
MENRGWLYYLLNKSGLSYYKKNGIVQLSSLPKPLKYTSDGWQDINIGWERSLETWGNNRNFSLPQGFVLDGAEILGEIFHTKNIEETVYLLIQKQTLVITPTEYYFFYKYFYKGELDLTTAKDTETKFTVNIMEGGLSKSYKAYESTKFEISPVDVKIKMDGFPFRGTRRFVVIEPAYNHAISIGVQEMIPMVETSSEGNFFNWYFKPEAASTTDVGYSFITSYDIVTDPDGKANGSVTADSEVVFHMEGTIQKNVTGGGPFGNRVGLDVNVTTSLGRDFTLFSLNHTFAFPGDTWKFSVDSALTQIFKDEKFYVYTTPNANQSNNVWEWKDDVRFEYQTRDVYKTTFVDAKRAVIFYSDLVDKVSGVTGKAVSSLLQAHQNYTITSGDAVRGIENAVVKTSLVDFRKAFDVVETAGVGIIKDKLYLEEKSFFLKDENVIPLGHIKKPEIEEAKELLGSTFSIGYNHNDSDDVNGKLSFNNTSVYTLPIKKVTTGIEKITNYITDPYVIELYRANLEGKKTTDNSKDNSVIILNIDYDNPQTLAEETDGLPAGTVYYNLKREAYDSITGVFNGDRLYNIADLTPARLMEKHMPYLNSILYKFEGEQIVFQTTDKNRELRTQAGATIYDEDANYIIDGVNRYFKPLFFTITPLASNEIVELLEDNPNRCFSFIHPNGLTYRGFNIKVGVAANDLEEQAFKLLAVADQDLTTLKNWY